MLLLDLTHRLGQDAGDQLMRKLAQRLRTDLVQSPLIARVSERQLMLAERRHQQRTGGPGAGAGRYARRPNASGL